MREIPLTGGGVALVDDADYKQLSRYKWSLLPNGYAARVSGSNRCRRSSIYMHRVIAGATTCEIEVDHWDLVKTNNQRRNLRICTRSQNHANAPKRPGCASRFKGVTRGRHGAKWQARLVVGGRRISLGEFASEEQAARAYDGAATLWFREFARLNLPTTLGSEQ